MIALMVKHLWVIAAVSLLGAAVAAWQLHGQRHYKAGYAAATARISAELAAAAEKQRETAQQASSGYQTDKAKREQKERVRYVEVQKIVERPVYRNVCIDDDGLRIINQAVNER